MGRQAIRFFGGAPEQRARFRSWRDVSAGLPRQVAMYLCRKYTETSFPAIGDKFGGRDHSTVIHASKTIERKIKEDPHMQTTIEKLGTLLNTVSR